MLVRLVLPDVGKWAGGNFDASPYSCTSFARRTRSSLCAENLSEASSGEAADSGPQRRKPPRGIPQPHPGPEKPTQGEEPPKKGGGSLFSEGHTRSEWYIGSRLLRIALRIRLGPLGLRGLLGGNSIRRLITKQHTDILEILINRGRVDIIYNSFLSWKLLEKTKRKRASIYRESYGKGNCLHCEVVFETVPQ